MRQSCPAFPNDDSNRHSRSERPRTECSVSFVGLEVTETESREIIREALEHHRAKRLTVLLFALAGMV